MISYNVVTVKRYKQYQNLWPIGLIAIAYLSIGLWLIPQYMNWDANACMGLLMAPFIGNIKKGQYSLRYFAPALIAVALALILPIRTALFAAILFAIVLLFENCIGKLDFVFVLILLLISPVFKHITRLVELPLRLWLSEDVAGVLSFIGLQASSAGNQIAIGKYEFSVDPACAGLNMLITSLLICLFIVAASQQKLQKRLPLKYLLALLVGALGLNIACNFFRILTLVLFKFMPGTVMHDFIGLVCLALYVIIPVLKLAPLIVDKLGIQHQSIHAPSLNIGLRHSILHVLILVAVLLSSYRRINLDTIYQPSKKDIKLPGYRQTNLTGGIIKLQSETTLIYIKPTAYYAPEHDPTVCWTGSGYQFAKVGKQTINGIQLYTGVLKKGKDKLYTAWWFDNGRERSINQVEWRWHALRTEQQFYLVNVSASNAADLNRALGHLLSHNILQ
ncbi:exosortase N [Mucilaginibacter lacusdianchii]|uniref:exosortase N n=1 Tax=Mucilaginibacter lacusdianchii TaxID=2684211 RepID=UPI00131E667F|nr:exosortase N [Mucilaginibacter sp. JXJ CY 39]